MPMKKSCLAPVMTHYPKMDTGTVRKTIKWSDDVKMPDDRAQSKGKTYQKFYERPKGLDCNPNFKSVTRKKTPEGKGLDLSAHEHLNLQKTDDLITKAQMKASAIVGKNDEVFDKVVDDVVDVVVDGALNGEDESKSPTDGTEPAEAEVETENNTGQKVVSRKEK